MEVVVFPKDYEKNRHHLEEENKVFIKGRVSEEDDAASKLICESVVPFEQTKKELWLQYANKQEFLSQEYTLYEMLASSDGEDQVIIYCKAERAVKRLPMNRNVHVDERLLGKLSNYLGETNIKVIEKSIESKS